MFGSSRMLNHHRPNVQVTCLILGLCQFSVRYCVASIIPDLAWDDVAYLTDLVAEARKVRDFGPLYFFGYSNGGFMSYHMACKGIPGLRAVASLSGTSYVEDSTCDGAPPVSVLHIHGTEDSVILFNGDETKPDPKSNGERAFYASAHDMVTRLSQRAGCNWPQVLDPYATLSTVRPRPRDPSLPPRISLRRRNQHRALERRRQQPHPRLHHHLHRRPPSLAPVPGVTTPHPQHRSPIKDTQCPNSRLRHPPTDPLSLGERAGVRVKAFRRESTSGWHPSPTRHSRESGNPWSGRGKAEGEVSTIYSELTATQPRQVLDIQY